MKAKVLVTFVNAACKVYGISPEDIYRTCRKREVKDLRHALCYIIKTNNQSMSLSEVARVFNRSDHTTVMHSIRACRDYMKNEPDYFFMVTYLEEIYNKINRAAMLSELINIKNELSRYDNQAA